MPAMAFGVHVLAITLDVVKVYASDHVLMHTYLVCALDLLVCSCPEFRVISGEFRRDPRAMGAGRPLHRHPGASNVASLALVTHQSRRRLCCGCAN